VTTQGTSPRVPDPAGPAVAGTARAPATVPAVPDLAASLHGVTRLFNGLPAVIGIDLDVPVGRTVWLRGPNGSGKSTLLRILATVLSPTFGSGFILGHDLLRGRDRIRRRLEYLGHQPRLYGDLTAAENLRFTCALHGVDPRQVMPALAATGLDPVADVRAGAFSQGMRQRLALARVVLRDPDLILLDEPYAGLDDDARSIVDELLRRAQARGRTVVLASHETPTFGMVDATVALDAGRLLRTEPRTPAAAEQPVRRPLREPLP
jgi:heme exporter protein A